MHYFVAGIVCRSCIKVLQPVPRKVHITEPMWNFCGNFPRKCHKSSIDSPIKRNFCGTSAGISHDSSTKVPHKFHETELSHMKVPWKFHSSSTIRNFHTYKFHQSSVEVPQKFHPAKKSSTNTLVKQCFVVLVWNFGGTFVELSWNFCGTSMCESSVS